MTSILIALLLSATQPGSGGAQVRGSAHDLTRPGLGAVRTGADLETGACAFCHASHGTGPGLSSRPELGGGQHVPYASASMSARPGTPSGATRACLSCHDGTTALGATRTTGRGAPNAAASGPLPATRPSNLGMDLRRGHPVSFQPSLGAGTHLPGDADGVRLDRSGQVQCTSCHDPHRQQGGDPSGQFLVKSTRHGALCLSCHDASAVAPGGASHATSARSFGPAEGNVGGAASVADAGCAACHVSHGAEPGTRLVRRGPGEEDDAPCLRCHASAAVRVPMGQELAKPFGHVRLGGGVHDAAEGAPGGRPLPETSSAARRHVTCVDCHDPHAASDRPAMGGAVGGALAGVWGIDQAGQRVERVRFEYEVCFKCHADSANRPPPGRGNPQAPRRAVTDGNLRRVFDRAAISSHPVTAPGRGTSVPSLLPPLTTASLVACSDCHASDRGPGAGPRGPHASAYPGLLERPYLTADRTVEGPGAYGLCYKCHDRERLLRGADSPFTSATRGPLHDLHVVRQATPCSVCHAAHGVSSLAGVSGQNEHLVDFDLNVVKPGASGAPVYRSLGVGKGSCALTCHDRPHAPANY